MKSMAFPGGSARVKAKAMAPISASTSCRLGGWACLGKDMVALRRAVAGCAVKRSTAPSKGTRPAEPADAA
jgi:hypothetical protein